MGTNPLVFLKPWLESLPPWEIAAHGHGYATMIIIFTWTRAPFWWSIDPIPSHVWYTFSKMSGPIRGSHLERLVTRQWAAVRSRKRTIKKHQRVKLRRGLIIYQKCVSREIQWGSVMSAVKECKGLKQKNQSCDKQKAVGMEKDQSTCTQEYAKISVLK